MSNSLATDAGSLAELARAVLEGTAAPPPIAKLIGFRPVAMESGRAVFELDSDLARHANPMAAFYATWQMQPWASPTPAR
jgi:hypothetical protein